MEEELVRFLPFLALSTVGAAILTADPGFAQAKQRATTIFMTQNHAVGTGRGQFPAECLGSVATETIPSKKGDPIRWTVINGNGQDDTDQCRGLEVSQVELVFDTDVMGSPAKRRLRGKGKSVDGNVTNLEKEAPTNSRHKYQVFYKGVPAGPDPEIIVDCPSCGPGGGGPGNK
jgi:hypothetical protein